MDRNKIQVAVMGAVATVMTVVTISTTDDHNHSENDIPREPRVNRDYERELYMNRVLYSGDIHCINQIRMTPNAFLELCKALSASNFLCSSINVSIREQVMIFCHIIGHNVRFRVIGGRFYRSTETVHRYFKIVLQAILKLYKHLIQEPSNSTPPEIGNSRRFYPYFRDCIGAIDGTHVRASVPLEIQGRFRGRKDGTTQNVLAAVTFDLRFCYVLAGWEGFCHDSRVLSDALSKPNGFIIPKGKYYLADAGYGIQNGIISPYRGVRYHLKEFSDHPLENEKELFNLRHSTLTTTVERAFEVLKKRFRVLDSEPFWSFKTQVDVVLACCIIHNFIMGVDPNDSIMEEMNREIEIPRENPRNQLSQREEKEENKIWALKRDKIANAMWISYQNIRRNQ